MFIWSPKKRLGKQSLVYWIKDNNDENTIWICLLLDVVNTREKKRKSMAGLAFVYAIEKMLMKWRKTRKVYKYIYLSTL